MNYLAKIPLFSAKIITVIIYFLLAFWILRRPRDFILQGAPNRKGWRDLRLWAFILIGFQIALYLMF